MEIQNTEDKSNLQKNMKMKKMVSLTISRAHSISIKKKVFKNG